MEKAAAHPQRFSETPNGNVVVPKATYTVQQLLPPPGAEWWGLAVRMHGRITDIVLKEGQDPHAAAAKYLEANGVRDDAYALQHLGESLDSVGGSTCDACKTFVEEATARFLKYANKERHDQKLTKVRNGVTVGWSVNWGVGTLNHIRQLCESPEMTSYTSTTRTGCRWYMERNMTANVFIEGEANGPADIVRRKQRVCGDVVKHCAPRPQLQPQQLSPCRKCAETMMDLGYLVRRDARSIEFLDPKHQHASPLREVLSRARMPRARGYRSRIHVQTRFAELCDTTPDRHRPGIGEEIRDACEDIASEHEAAIVDAFADMYSTDTEAVREVCVTTTNACTDSEYEGLRKSLVSYRLDQPGGMAQRQSVSSGQPGGQ